MTTLEFDGIPFDPVTAPADVAAQPGVAADPRSSAGAPAPAADAGGRASAGTHERAADVVAQGHAADAVAQGHEDTPRAGGSRPVGVSRQDGTASTRSAQVLGEVRSGVVAAHRAALGAQVALQRAVWQKALRSAGFAAPDPDGHSGGDSRDVAGEGAAFTDGGHSGRTGGGSASPTGATPRTKGGGATGRAAAESAFKPLARTDRTRLDRAMLDRLAEGDLTGVFGPGHARLGVESATRLAASTPLALTEVTSIELYGGTGRGRVEACFDGDPRAAAVQAAEVFALFTGMPLVLSGSSLVGEFTGAAEGITAGTLDFTVTDLDLVPRPHITGTARITPEQGATGGTAQAAIDVTVTVVERPGSGVGPGEVSSGLLLNEFHMAHLARGDQAVALGPEFAPYTGVRATRLPTGGLLLVDRVRDFDGERGKLDAASYRTEYDSPADSWYYADTANDSMPHFVYMETSLQAALLMGYYAGPTLTQPGTTLSLRNLGGTATVLRQVDLRDKTIEQSSRLLSTTILPGSSLQTFDYTLSVDGEPFYTGETMFGYFSDEALANQTGLDAGRSVPTWLAGHPEARVRTIDVAARRADAGQRLCARRTLALVDRVEVVDGGGDHQAGYLHSLRPIDPSDWFFARHFHLDPVIPGSLGVESVIHAVQEWMIDAGFADTLDDPVFRIPADIPFSWRYRGQFLPTDGTVELEAHIKQVRRGPRGVTVVVDGSLWKPGLRIYELVDLAVELVERKDR